MQKGTELEKGVWVVVVWSIWNHRNGVIFKEGKVNVEEIVSLAQLQA